MANLHAIKSDSKRFGMNSLRELCCKNGFDLSPGNLLTQDYLSIEDTFSSQGAPCVTCKGWDAALAQAATGRIAPPGGHASLSLGTWEGVGRCAAHLAGGCDGGCSDFQSMTITLRFAPPNIERSIF